MVTVPTLNLVCESKICDLIPCDHPTERWEASGVLVKDRHYFVVFDDRTEIACFSNDLKPNTTNGLFGTTHADWGYEGITYNAAPSNGFTCWSKHANMQAVATKL
jgi:hypothetical protein